MTMNITSKQMEITPAIRQHVADRLAKLEKWQTHLINPHIILSKEPQGFVADATINTPNGVLVASGKHEDMYTAINELINKLERQLNKLQHKGEARRAATSVKDLRARFIYPYHIEIKGFISTAVHIVTTSTIQTPFRRGFLCVSISPQSIPDIRKKC